eukprot:scaffold586_cov112-Skeletonema_dohrnii-CCMP3373.AAC.20
MVSEWTPTPMCSGKAGEEVSCWCGQDQEEKLVQKSPSCAEKKIKDDPILMSAAKQFGTAAGEAMLVLRRMMNVKAKVKTCRIKIKCTIKMDRSITNMIM